MTLIHATQWFCLNIWTDFLFCYALILNKYLVPLFNQEKDSLRLKSLFQECPGQDRQPSLHIQINNIVTTYITKPTYNRLKTITHHIDLLSREHNKDFIRVFSKD